MHRVYTVRFHPGITENRAMDHLAAGNWAEGCPSLSLFAALQNCGASPNIENDAGESARATLKANL